MAITPKDLLLVQAVLGGDTDLDSAEQGIQLLRQLDDAYFEDDPLVPDIVYDAFRLHVKSLDSKHPYFSSVGADVRGGKIDLPYQLGSLDQVEVGGLTDWIRKAGLKPTDELLITAKLDGASALGSFEKVLKIAYSRGNGFQGADITRHVKHFVPKKTLVGWVRGENIIRKDTFETIVQPNYMRSGGQPYKNPRNAISGMMNASSHDDATVYQHLNFVAYDILGSDLDKTEQLQLLQKSGFIIPQHRAVTVGQLTEQVLAEFIDKLRGDYEYEVDGVVVDVNSAAVRKRLNDGNEDLNPKFAFKYKVADTSNYAETEVVRVEWNLSKSGYFKPRVIVKPAKLPGITWTYATGYNAKWIVDNGIGPGAVVGGQRMGDVVPNIIRVIKSVQPQMPDEAFVWNATSVDIVALNLEDHEEIWIQQLVHAVSKIDFPHLKEGSIRHVVEHLGTRSFDSTMQAILQMDSTDWVEIIGANGKKIHDGIKAKMAGIDYYLFVGSMPHFGRGIGTRKMRKVFEVCKDLVGFKMLDVDDIIDIEGFEETTADKIVSGIDKFFAFYDGLSIKPVFKATEVEGAILNGHNICVTGFRDKALEAWIEANGGKAQSGVSGTTTILVAADPKSNSGKVQKANEINAKGKGKVEILSLAQFNEMFGR